MNLATIPCPAGYVSPISLTMARVSLPDALGNRYEPSTATQATVSRSATVAKLPAKGTCYAAFGGRKETTGLFTKTGKLAAGFGSRLAGAAVTVCSAATEVTVSAVVSPELVVYFGRIAMEEQTQRKGRAGVPAVAAVAV